MKIHIVQKGDTLWKIANKYNVDFEELKKMNSQLSDPNTLKPGMKIKVPTGGVPVKKEKQGAPQKPMFPSGEMNTPPKMTPENQNAKPAPKQENMTTKPKKQENNKPPKQENSTMPETAWSFHYPPMNDGPKHFPPMEEMPQSESNDLQPMFPPSAGFYPQHNMMQNMSQPPEQNAGCMPDSMNVKPYSAECMPKTEAPPQAGNGMYPMHGSIHQEYQMPSSYESMQPNPMYGSAHQEYQVPPYGSMPPTAPNSMHGSIQQGYQVPPFMPMPLSAQNLMPASPCECGAETNQSPPMGKGEWNKDMKANWAGSGNMTQYPSWGSDSKKNGMMPPHSWP